MEQYGTIGALAFCWLFCINLTSIGYRSFWLVDYTRLFQLEWYQSLWALSSPLDIARCTFYNETQGTRRCSNSLPPFVIPVNESGQTKCWSENLVKRLRWKFAREAELSPLFQQIQRAFLAKHWSLNCFRSWTARKAVDRIFDWSCDNLKRQPSPERLIRHPVCGKHRLIPCQISS